MYMILFYILPILDELYGDFEDLETGEVHHTDKPPTGLDYGVSSDDDDKQDEKKQPKEEKEKEKSDKQKRMEQKRKLKQAFDIDYDGKGDGDYFDDLKAQMAEQSQVRRYKNESLHHSYHMFSNIENMN